MEQLASVAAEDGKAQLKQLPAVVKELRDFVTMTWGTTGYKEVADRLEKDDGRTVAALVQGAEEKVIAAIDILTCVERWVALSEPALESGNNFGVDVQRHILKCCKERREGLENVAEGIFEYAKMRCELAEKVAPRCSVKNSTQKVTSTTSGSVKEEENGTKSVETVTEIQDKETKESSLGASKALAALDLRWFFKSKRIVMAVMDALAVTCDQAEKNLGKIENPRGNDGGSSSFSMY